jgi:quinol monooxygenase YgiN
MMVWWVLELDIQAGRDRDFAALMDDMVRATRANEAGTLTYEWTASADGRVCHIVERYVDSAAVLTHLATFRDQFAGRFLDILKPVRLVVYGSPSPSVKDALAGLNPTYMRTVGGFTR